MKKVFIINKTEYDIGKEFIEYRDHKFGKGSNPYHFVELIMTNDFDKCVDINNQLIFLIYEIGNKFVSFPLISPKNTHIILISESEIDKNVQINVKSAKILNKSSVLKYIYKILNKGFGFVEFYKSWEKILRCKLPFSMVDKVVLCGCGYFHLKNPCSFFKSIMTINEKVDFETAKYISDNFTTKEPIEIPQNEDCYYVGNYKIETDKGSVVNVIYEKNKIKKIIMMREIAIKEPEDYGYDYYSHKPFSGH